MEGNRYVQLMSTGKQIRSKPRTVASHLLISF